MHSENRRSFVKKSLATSVSISFTGLIRAHGEGGVETTTSNPEETTYATTDSGGTTTWNPDVSTIATTSPEETTWNPEETTTPPTTIETTIESTFKFKAKITDRTPDGKISSKVFQIGSTWYEATLYWVVVQEGDDTPWNDKTYKSAFAGKLRQKMANDPQAGPYTGSVTPVVSNSATSATSTTHWVQAKCDLASGNMTCTQVELEQDENTPVKPRFLIDGKEYKLQIEKPIIGVTEGEGSSILTTRDKALLNLLDVSTDSTVLGSVVDTDDVTVPGHAEDEDNINPSGCYIISESFATT